MEKTIPERYQKLLPVMRVVDQILRLSTTVTEEEINEALNIISRADSTFGVLWGQTNSKKGMNKHVHYPDV